MGGPRAGTSSRRSGIGRPRTRASGPRAGTGGPRARPRGFRAGRRSSRARPRGLQTGTGSSRARPRDFRAGTGRPRARASGPRAGAGRLGARPGRPDTAVGRWPTAVRNHARTGHGVMLLRWPAERCRASLPPASTGGAAFRWPRDPACGRASADRHGISGWLRRRSGYHGSLRAGRDASPERAAITNPLATGACPGGLGRRGRPSGGMGRKAACPAPGPRCRPLLTQCCGVRLNEAGRPAASIQDGSSMLALLPRFLLFPQRTATGMRTRRPGRPVRMPRR